MTKIRKAKRTRRKVAGKRPVADVPAPHDLRLSPVKAQAGTFQSLQKNPQANQSIQAQEQKNEALFGLGR
jgi:hypothetical protein